MLGTRPKVPGMATGVTWASANSPALPPEAFSPGASGSITVTCQPSRRR